LELPGWYTAVEYQIAEEEKIKYPDGSYILGMSFGITGVLSALSLSAIAGIQLPGLLDTISRIGNWLKERNQPDSCGINWPHTQSLNLSMHSNANGEISRDTWWYGIPGVTRALYLAATATKDKTLKIFAEKTFLSVFTKTIKDWNLMGPSFVHGRSGLLAITYRMAQDTQNPFLWKKINILEDDLKGFYKSDSPFGFRMVSVDSSDVYHWVDHPGLFRGAIGIALSLLLVQRRGELLWDRAFLLN
jgi:hypothetical protein